jgi:hypothetical protein
MKFLSGLLVLALAVTLVNPAVGALRPPPASGSLDFAQMALEAVRDGRYTAARTLLEQSTAYQSSPRTQGYILRQIAELSLSSPGPYARWAYELNRGCAYHNLMLYFRQAGLPEWPTLAGLARQHYQRSLQFDPSSPRARLCLAALDLEVGNVAAAERDYAGVELSALQDVNAKLLMAYYLMAKKDVGGTLAWLAEAIAADRAEAVTWAAESNDFDPIREDPRFIRLLADNP